MSLSPTPALPEDCPPAGDGAGVRQPGSTNPGAPHHRTPVAFVIDKLHRAGAQTHLAQLVRRLSPREFAPVVYCLLSGGAVADELLAAGIPVRVLGLGRLYTPPSLWGLLGLSRRLKRDGVALVHTYLASANAFGALAGRLAGPILVTSRRDMGFSRTRGLRFVEERFVNPVVRVVTTPSPAVSEVTRAEAGLDPAKVVTIPNGVDLERFDSSRHSRAEGRRSLGLADEQLGVGVLAHLSSPVKGHADFIHACARVAASRSQVRFFVVGDGTLRPQLEALTRELGLASRVVFTGVRADIPRVLAALDTVVLPSHSEGLSNALLEAMAMARPVVATAVGGSLDVVEDGVTGLLVPPKSPDDLARALLRIEAHPDEASSMGRAARDRVESDYSVDGMVKRYEGLYRSLFANPTRPG